MSPITLTFYTKPDCSLCDRLLALMKPIVDRCQEEGGAAVELKFVDITNERALQGQYRFRIPVVLFEQEVLFEGHPHRQTVETALQSILLM